MSDSPRQLLNADGSTESEGQRLIKKLDYHFPRYVPGHGSLPYHHRMDPEAEKALEMVKDYIRELEQRCSTMKD